MSPTEENFVIDVTNLDFSYAKGGFRLQVDRFKVPAGGHVALVGPSGSGKSTLLNLLAGILNPNGGRVTVAGNDLRQLGDSARRDFRISKIGLVFQEFELLEYLNVLDNVLLPFRINRSLDLSDEVRQRARELLSHLEIADKLKRYPAQLSQGERQRVAIGRALVTEPELLLADEPTGNLDPTNKQRVLDLMLDQAARRGLTVVMVTHDHGILDRFEKVFDVSEFYGHTELPEVGEAVHSAGSEANQE